MCKIRTSLDSVSHKKWQPRLYASISWNSDRLFLLKMRGFGAARRGGAAEAAANTSVNLELERNYEPGLTAVIIRKCYECV